jgi:hypothetical protein
MESVNRQQMARGCPRLLSSVENKRCYPLIHINSHNLSELFGRAWLYDSVCKFGTAVEIMPHAAQIPMATYEEDQKATLYREHVIGYRREKLAICCLRRCPEVVSENPCC